MTLRIQSVEPRRERSVVILHITGELPDPSHQIVGARKSVDGSRIGVDLSVESSGEMAAQVLTGFTRSVDLGRLAGGTFQLTVSCNGEPCHSERLKIPV